MKRLAILLSVILAACTALGGSPLSAWWYSAVPSTSAAVFSPPLDSIVAYYFVNTNLTTLVDSSGKANSGYLDAAAKPIPLQIAATPKVINGYLLSGGATNLFMTNTASFGFLTNSAFTLAVWAKFPDATSGNIIGKQLNAAPWTSYCIDYGAGYPEIYIAGSAGAWYLRANAAPANAIWHRFVLAYTGEGSIAGVKLYVDGAVSAVSTQANTAPGSLATVVPLTVGARGASGASANCKASMQVFLPVVATSAWSSAVVLSDYLTTNPTNFLGVLP